jgi:hypothetical protein
MKVKRMKGLEPSTFCMAKGRAEGRNPAPEHELAE